MGIKRDRAASIDDAAWPTEIDQTMPSKKAKPSSPPPASEASKQFLVDNQIVIHEVNHAPCCTNFADAPFPGPLVQFLQKQPFDAPSAIQGSTWPIAVEGRDIIAVAKTGSGKTLGYLMPALAKCYTEKSAAGGAPIVLIMSPTRELAMQIQEQAFKFGQPLGIKSVAVYGGAPKNPQWNKIKQGVEIIVATPGRMMDMLDLHNNAGWAACKMDKCSMLVLDEADRMLDMGFEKDIRLIVANMPENRQTLLYTATWPKAIQRIASELLKPNKVKVTVGSGGDKLTANKSVTQRVQVVEKHEKWDAFLKIMEQYKPGEPNAGKRFIIFANTKRDVNAICKHYWDLQYNIDSVSGDRTQRDREKTIRQFRSGQVTGIVATDVAARGLDIQGVEHVINYDFPRDAADDYIHRIGRTGRAGATGMADTLFTRDDARFGNELIRILTDAGQVVPEEMNQFKRSSGGKGKGKGKSRFGSRGGKGKGGGGYGGGKGRRW
jgi:ATP-dependent RNA helicase DDX5/DBP2